MSKLLLALLALLALLEDDLCCCMAASSDSRQGKAHTRDSPGRRPPAPEKSPKPPQLGRSSLLQLAAAAHAARSITNNYASSRRPMSATTQHGLLADLDHEWLALDTQAYNKAFATVAQLWQELCEANTAAAVFKHFWCTKHILRGKALSWMRPAEYARLREIRAPGISEEQLLEHQGVELVSAVQHELRKKGAQNSVACILNQFLIHIESMIHFIKDCEDADTIWEESGLSEQWHTVCGRAEASGHPHPWCSQDTKAEHPCVAQLLGHQFRHDDQMEKIEWIDDMQGCTGYFSDLLTSTAEPTTHIFSFYETTFYGVVVLCITVFVEDFIFGRCLRRSVRGACARMALTKQALRARVLQRLTSLHGGYRAATRAWMEAAAVISMTHPRQPVQHGTIGQPLVRMSTVGPGAPEVSNADAAGLMMKQISDVDKFSAQETKAVARQTNTVGHATLKRAQLKQKQQHQKQQQQHLSSKARSLHKRQPDLAYNSSASLGAHASDDAGAMAPGAHGPTLPDPRALTRSEASKSTPSNASSTRSPTASQPVAPTHPATAATTAPSPATSSSNTHVPLQPIDAPNRPATMSPPQATSRTGTFMTPQPAAPARPAATAKPPSRATSIPSPSTARQSAHKPVSLWDGASALSYAAKLAPQNQQSLPQSSSQIAGSHANNSTNVTTDRTDISTSPSKPAARSRLDPSAPPFQPPSSAHQSLPLAPVAPQPAVVDARYVLSVPVTPSIVALPVPQLPRHLQLPSHLQHLQPQQSRVPPTSVTPVLDPTPPPSQPANSECRICMEFLTTNRGFVHAGSVHTGVCAPCCARIMSKPQPLCPFCMEPVQAVLSVF